LPEIREEWRRCAAPTTMQSAAMLRRVAQMSRADDDAERSDAEEWRR
jgi:hypothetical protein